MAENETTVTELSKATGLSRTTLTEVKFNRNKTISYNTINTLCEILHTTPGEFFKYERDDKDD